jgi:LDH2 family malate/lactate/ureidoglycolate dehydrogenase
MSPSCLPEFGGGNGILMIALRIAAFVPDEQFADQAVRFSDAIASAQTASGVSAVMMPGEPEWNSRRLRLARGIDVPSQIWNDISQLARQLDVDVTT